MRQPRGAALSATILLLGAMEGSAQFLGGLANINPAQIASSLTNKSPKDIAADVIGSQEPKRIMEAIADTTPADAAKAVQEGGAAHVEKAAETITQAKQTVADAVHGAGSQPAQAAAAAAAPQAAAASLPGPSAPSSGKDSPPAASSPEKASVVDALKTVSDAIQHAGESLNQTNTGAVDSALNGTSPLAVAGAVQRAVEGQLPGTLEQAGKAAKAAIESNPDADALRKAGQGLVDTFHLPGSDFVHEAVEDAMKHATPETISDAVRDNSPKVADAIRQVDPKAVLPQPPHPGPAGGDVMPPGDGAAEQGANWWLVVTGICVAGAATAGGWHLCTSYKRRDTRSPTLLADAEMATWSRSSGQSRGPAHADEALFRNF